MLSAQRYNDFITMLTSLAVYFATVTLYENKGSARPSNSTKQGGTKLIAPMHISNLHTRGHFLFFPYSQPLRRYSDLNVMFCRLSWLCDLMARSVNEYSARPLGNSKTI